MLGYIVLRATSAGGLSAIGVFVYGLTAAGLILVSIALSSYLKELASAK